MRALLRSLSTRRPSGILLAAAVTLASTAVGLGAAHADPLADPLATAPDLGPNVTIVDASMPTAEIQTLLDDLAAAQTDDEMGSNRHAVLFMPGDYGSGTEPLQARVGYYTEIAGLGAQPQDVSVQGKIEVLNRCLENNGTSYCVALNNFWRTIGNLSLQVNGVGQDGCRASANFWAVSQAVSMRRLDISGGNLSLMDYCSAGPQFASGGFIADSRLPFVINGSQQQWLTRNTEVGGWSNGVWNQVFAGVEGAPSEVGFPVPPYTVLENTPRSREKPYLYVDDAGSWLVRVPSSAAGTRGISWADGMTPGRSIPLDQFFIAKPGDPIGRMNAALARGQHLLLTPGVYDVGSSILVRRAGSVVLGLGHATLTATGGAIPVRVSDADGIVIAGVTIDAGATESRVLMEVGRPNSRAVLDPANPITLSDVYFRVGGPHIGKVDTALVVNSDHVLIDHTWVWRADHGVEDFSAGVSGDTDRWNTNIGRIGVVVNGDDVTATGLFVEHFQQFNTIWNGERGEVVLYQNELPYDAPTQADWTQPDGTLGFPGYMVSAGVSEHALHGGGVYVFNRNDPSIVTENGFEVPEAAGVRLRHVMTVNLGAGTINHVVNGVGSQVDNSNTGIPSYVVEFPAP